jgi:hypothetical protein
VAPRPRWRRRLGVVALVLLLGPGAARASYYIAPEPDYVLSVWLRFGFTSKGRVMTGLALDLLPFTAGIDVAPHNELGTFRVFAGLKGGFTATPAVCSLWAGLSGAAVYAFTPGQAGHFGVRVGAHVEHRPISVGGPPLSFPQVEEGGSYRFSWFPGTATLHDGGLDLGLLWAPNGDCESD